MVSFGTVDVADPSVSGVGILVAGRYRITGILGQGGMGLVLSARDETGERDVALKLLQSIGDVNVERFLREARVGEKLESEHIVQVLDVGSRAGRPFLVMERLRGDDFGAMLRPSTRETSSKLVPLPLVEVADCVVQTCEALARAHGAGIVHRDIKASNLFAHRREDGSRIVKVLDFGISKVFADAGASEATLTRTSDRGGLGSPPYMSPEHIRDPRMVDGRTDLWSLGVVAYRLLSARYPFAGESANEVGEAIVARRPLLLREHGIDVPDEVEAIIARCLARDRDDRFPDAGALAAAFSPFASEPWARYGELVRAIVERAPAPKAPPTVTTRLADARALLGDPPTKSLPSPLAETAQEPPKTDGPDPWSSVTRPMPQRLRAVPRPAAVPVEIPAPRAGRPWRWAALLAFVASLVSVGIRWRHPPKPDESTTRLVAPTGVTAVASDSPPPTSSRVLEPIPAPPPPAPASVTTPLAVPRATRRRGPAPPPAPSASQTPRSVLQANPYAQ
jgi:serine/threonine-protein kinase